MMAAMTSLEKDLATMEKGIPGDKVFDEAMKAWGAASG